MRAKRYITVSYFRIGLSGGRVLTRPLRYNDRRPAIRKLLCVDICRISIFTNVQNFYIFLFAQQFFSQILRAVVPFSGSSILQKPLAEAFPDSIPIPRQVRLRQVRQVRLQVQVCSRACRFSLDMILT